VLKSLTLCNHKITTNKLERGLATPLFFCINSSMTTSQSPLSRQPTKLDYLSPTQFRFLINQLPKVEFFTTAASIPSITLGDTVMPTRFKEIPMMGDMLDYEPLTITFLVDEYLENYTSLHEWMTSIGFPENHEQFSTFRGVTSNTPVATKGNSRDIGDVQPSTTARGVFSDATLTILSNKNNPIAEARFEDIYPTNLGALEFNQNATDVDYITVTATFAYKIYKIITL